MIRPTSPSLVTIAIAGSRANEGPGTLLHNRRGSRIQTAVEGHCSKIHHSLYGHAYELPSQAVVKPPSTECVVPVAYLESFDSKKQTTSDLVRCDMTSQKHGICTTSETSSASLNVKLPGDGAAALSRQQNDEGSEVLDRPSTPLRCVAFFLFSPFRIGQSGCVSVLARS